MYFLQCTCNKGVIPYAKRIAATKWKRLLTRLADDLVRYPGVIRSKQGEATTKSFSLTEVKAEIARWKEQGVDASCCRLPRLQSSFVSFMLLMRDRIIAPNYRGLVSSSCLYSAILSFSYFRSRFCSFLRVTKTIWCIPDPCERRKLSFSCFW